MKLEEAKEILPTSLYEELVRLLEEKRVPKEKREKIIERVVEEYLNSKVDYGEAVGMIAAQTVGERATQLTMRTKHFAGVEEKNITLGLPRLIEIVDAKPIPSTPIMRIYLKDGKDEERVREFAKKIQQITLEDISKEIDIDVFNFRIILKLDPNRMDEYEIKKEDIEKSLKKIKKGVTKIEKDKIIIECKEKTIKSLYSLKKRIKETLVHGVKGIEQVVIRKEGGEWIIETAGSNLAEILKMEEVDKKRTITNDIIEIAKVLGIEAARNAIIREIKSTLEERGINIDIRHIMLIADVMTADGKVMGATRYGVPKEKASILARAGFEMPIRHLSLASIFGMEDNLSGVIENVMINQVIPLGTGMPKLIYEAMPNEGERAPSKRE